ncbi:MAG: hypothetical protein VYD29_05540 [Pseudomonadota bacterium]|nr:hypothetical protein [Pseudomonadota bacterium]
MNLSSFRSEIKKIDQDFLQSILDGSALVMVRDEALGLGGSNGAFVIFWIEDEKFSSVDDLRDYLDIEAEDLLTNYYQHSPLSKEYFEKKLSDLMLEYGEAAFASQPGEMPEKSIIVSNGELQVLSDKDYIFQYGLYLKLEDKLTPQISADKAKNWLQSGTAYNDYIAINVFRFSSIE